MKFKFLGIEITIRKDFMFIGIIMLIMILILWGWYLKANRVEVFDAGKKQTEEQTSMDEEQHETNDNITGSAKENSKEPFYININTADIDTLTKLHGIGKVKAKAIIEYREQNGPFNKIEDIKNVKGIGEATFLKIKDRIIVGTEGRKPYNTDLLK
ncbi:MAG TPA: helix-hairpin-helix domain-containing protein [Thermoclostridium sp.]